MIINEISYQIAFGVIGDAQRQGLPRGGLSNIDHWIVKLPIYLGITALYIIVVNIVKFVIVNILYIGIEILIVVLMVIIRIIIVKKKSIDTEG